MNTAPAAPSAFTGIGTPTTGLPGRTGRHAGHGVRNAALALGAAALTLTGLATVQYLQNREATASGTSGVTAVTADVTAYAPGGSVYAQQVPTALTADVTAYAPGGSVYAQQVPTALTANTRDTSVYDRKIPTDR